MNVRNRRSSHLLFMLAFGATALGLQTDQSHALVAAHVESIAGENWAQWRGPAGQGVSAEKGVPTRWSDTLNVRWKTAIDGRGHSSPIVWGDRVFLTTAIEGPMVPGAGQIKHIIDGAEYRHPDTCCGDR